MIDESEETVIVSGGSGFIGSAIANHFASRGKKVRSLFHSKHPHERLHPSIDWHKTNLLRPLEMEFPRRQC